MASRFSQDLDLLHFRNLGLVGGHGLTALLARRQGAIRPRNGVFVISREMHALLAADSRCKGTSHRSQRGCSRPENHAQEATRG